MRSCVKYALIATIVTSCRLGPDYMVPAVEVPSSWSAPSSVPETCDYNLVAWWENFHDPFLSSYMERIYEENLNIQMANERIAQAISMRKITSSKIYPDIEGRIAYNHSKPGNFGALGATAAATILKIDQETTQTELDAFWEIDLFGRIQRQVESAVANLGVQIEIRNGLLISSLSEFARNYIQVRGNQNLLAINEEQIRFLREEVELTKRRYTAGVDRDQQLLVIEEELTNLESQALPIQIQLYAGIYRLSVLIGKNPDYLFEAFSSVEKVPDLPPNLPEVLPSELLLRRPDIRQAERNIAVYTADLGTAYAELFPRVNLNGIDGFERIRIQDLLLKANMWSYGIDILTPIFKGGRLLENIRLHDSQRYEAMLNYRQTILQAFEETENALTHYALSIKILNDANKSYKLQTNLYKHAENQYEVGVINKIDFMNAKRLLLNSQQQLTQAKVEAGVALVFLYKSLGGGW